MFHTIAYFLIAYQVLIVIYFLSINSIYTYITVYAFGLIRKSSQASFGLDRLIGLSEATNFRPVSIVIPAHNEAENLATLLAEIRAALDPLVAYEVIVVDDASVGLAPLLGALEGDVKVIRSDRRIGFSAATQLGFGRALGELVVLVRGAAAPEPGWLPPLVAVLPDPTV